MPVTRNSTRSVASAPTPKRSPTARARATTAPKTPRLRLTMGATKAATAPATTPSSSGGVRRRREEQEDDDDDDDDEKEPKRPCLRASQSTPPCSDQAALLQQRHEKLAQVKSSDASPPPKVQKLKLYLTPRPQPARLPKLHLVFSGAEHQRRHPKTALPKHMRRERQRARRRNGHGPPGEEKKSKRLTKRERVARYRARKEKFQEERPSPLGSEVTAEELRRDDEILSRFLNLACEVMIEELKSDGRVHVG